MHILVCIAPALESRIYTELSSAIDGEVSVEKTAAQCSVGIAWQGVGYIAWVFAGRVWKWVCSQGDSFGSGGLG